MMEAEPKYESAKVDPLTKSEEEDLYTKLQQLNRQL